VVEHTLVESLLGLAENELFPLLMHYWFPALASWVIVTIKLEPVEHFNVFLSNIWGKMEHNSNVKFTPACL
jgi:L-asparagine transporter-like permease